ncbi:MAG: hypothetical protein K6G25_12395 [Bacteroidales bacterium]|nr:hypothetical protein [Bacteroidales bacterium]
MSELKTILSGRISGSDAKALAKADFGEELFQLLFDEDKRISDNAAWVMTHLPQAADTWLAEHQNTLIDEAMRTESTTKRRLIMNLIERTPFEVNHIRTDFLDFCFNIILSDEPVGVKTLAIKLTYAQSVHYPELLEEFNTALQMMEPEMLPAALKHIRGKMLKK